MSVGGRHQAARLINELAGVASGEIADAVMQAVLALHDDRVLDAGRLVTQAMAAEADHVWIELEPDLLELAAVVASRCDDHERASSCSAPASRHGRDGRRFRFRDQQHWIDDSASAPPRSSTPTPPTSSSPGRSDDDHDALAYARRGSGDRKRPATGWDALTPTEPRSSTSSPRA